MLTLCALALLACHPSDACAAPPDGDTLTVIDYCAVPGSCLPIDDAPEGADLQEMSWCCEWDTGDCTAVLSLLDCDPEMEFGVYCEWGMTVPQSSQTGTIDCYG